MLSYDFRSGQVVKKEYRGQRSVEALAEFIKKQLEDTIQQHTSMDELDEMQVCLTRLVFYLLR